MFGHDGDNSDVTQNGTQGSVSAEPLDDGTLALLANDNGDDNSADSHPDSVAPESAPPTPVTTPDPVVSKQPDQSVTTVDDDLIDIKQKALQQLKPLVGHLDQTPEEQFRTTMMMIQAADDQSLITKAYQSASAITDEKVRAQALLDVVNEINYFNSQRDN
jgi:hypothetical protein